MCKGAGSCLATRPLLVPPGGRQERICAVGLSCTSQREHKADIKPLPGEGRGLLAWVCAAETERRVKAGTAAAPKCGPLSRCTCKLLGVGASTAKSYAATQQASCQRGGTKHFRAIYKYLTYFLWIAQ